MGAQDTDIDAAAQLLMMRLRNGGAPSPPSTPAPISPQVQQLAALLKGK